MHYYPDELMALEAGPVTIPRPGLALPFTVLAATIAMAIVILASSDDPAPAPIAPPTVATSVVTQPATAPVVLPAAPTTEPPTTATEVTPVQSVPAISGGGLVPVIE